jgi:hypothetical protein
MELPEKAFDAPAFYGEDDHFASSVMRQIEKDFRLQGIDLILPESVPSYVELVGIVEEHLRHSELLHSPKFVGLLYQLDLSESKMRNLIKNTTPDGIHLSIAYEIVKRCAAKIYWRNTLR